VLQIDETLIIVQRKFAAMPDYLGKYNGTFCAKRIQKKNLQHLLDDFRSTARMIRSRGSRPCKRTRLRWQKRCNTTDARYLHNTSLFLLPHPHEQPHVNRFFFALPLAMSVIAFLSLSFSTKNKRGTESQSSAGLPPGEEAFRILERR